MGIGGDSTSPSAVDLEEKFGFVCLETSEFPMASEAKSVVSTSWHDEDGEDVYIPSEMRYEAFDWKVRVGVTGEIGTTKNKVDALIKWLAGKGDTPLPADGSGLCVWSEFYKAGFQHCYLKGVTDQEFSFCGSYEILECTLEIRVCDPMTRLSVVKRDSTLVLVKE